jgi:hypothetical protein
MFYYVLLPARFGFDFVRQIPFLKVDSCGFLRVQWIQIHLGLVDQSMIHRWSQMGDFVVPMTMVNLGWHSHQKDPTKNLLVCLMVSHENSPNKPHHIPIVSNPQDAWHSNAPMVGQITHSTRGGLSWDIFSPYHPAGCHFIAAKLFITYNCHYTFKKHVDISWDL